MSRTMERKPRNSSSPELVDAYRRTSALYLRVSEWWWEGACGVRATHQELGQAQRARGERANTQEALGWHKLPPPSTRSHLSVDLSPQASPAASRPGSTNMRAPAVLLVFVAQHIQSLLELAGRDLLGALLVDGLEDGAEDRVRRRRQFQLLQLLAHVPPLRLELHRRAAARLLGCRAPGLPRRRPLGAFHCPLGTLPLRRLAGRAEGGILCAQVVRVSIRVEGGSGGRFHLWGATPGAVKLVQQQT
eukprot:scaffold8611_cov108-Isochrysis_galbana.AAC.12